MRLLSHIILLLLISVAPLMAQETPETEHIGEIQPPNQQIKPNNKSKAQKEYQLEGIVVKERRIKNIEKPPIVKGGTTTEITGEDIQERSDKVLKDALYQVPGIQVVTQRKGNTQFYMRGYDMSKIAMLVDDIPLIDTFTGTMDIGNIGLTDISEIVVSRGVTSALYGTRGGVGSINLIRKKPTRIYTDFTAEYGEYNNFVTSISHGAPLGNFYYQFSAMYDKSDGYEVSDKLDRREREDWLRKLSRYDLYGFTLNDIYSHPGSSSAVYYLDDTGIWDHMGHEKYKLNVKTGYHVTPDLDTGISLFYNRTEMENSSYFTDMQSMYTYSSYTKDMDWRLPNSTYILRNMSSRWPEYNDYAVSPYVIFEKDRFGLKANAYYYEDTNKFMAYADPQEKVLAFNRDFFSMTWSIWTGRTYGTNIYPSYQITPGNRLNFALSYYLNDHIEEEQAYNEDSTKTIRYYGTGKYKMLEIEAAYLTFAVEDEMRLGKDIELTLGVSYDAQDLTKYQTKLGVDGSTEMVDQSLVEGDSMLWGTYDSINPVAGIVYEPIKDFLKLKAAASRKTSFPTLQAYTKIESPYQTSSDPESRRPDIEPEKMLNANLGFELSCFDKQLTWGADYFYSKYDDKITRVYITKIDDYVYRNIDSAVIHGAEATMNLNFVDVFDMADVTFSSTYTYIHSRNQANVDDSFINKGDRFEKLAEQKITFDFRTHFRTGTSLIVFGDYELNQIQYVMDSIPKPTDDFSTSYYHAQRLHDPLKIDIKLSQELYKHYEIYIMCRNILDDYNADPFNPGPGRMWFLGFKARF